jgi:hypothetical protein
MKIDIYKLHKLYDTYHDEFTCHLYADVVASGKKFKAGSELLLYDIVQLKKSRVFEIEVVFNVTLYEYLNREYPVEYRRPAMWLDYTALERYLEELDAANAQSKRKRYLTLVGDVYRGDIKSGQTQAVLRHGDRLEFNKWRVSKMYIDTSQKFFLRTSETGIIVFGALRAEEYADETDGYRKKIDLMGAMLSHRNDKKFEIAPDFIPNKDLRIVALPGQLAEEYINTEARLIIIDENLTAPQKDALLQVRNYDQFIRLMLAPPLTHQNIEHVLLQIKMMYNTERWKKK